MATHLTKESMLDVGAGSEHSSHIFIQLLLHLSRFKMIGSKL
jgi:hypothetical protein